MKGWELWSERRGGAGEAVLGGLGLRPPQAFFLSFAQTWCDVAEPRNRRIQLTADEHAIGKFR